MTPLYTPPNCDDTNSLASQWLNVSRLTEEVCGSSLTLAVSDLDLIQRLLDADEIEPTAYARQSLGVALGRVMARTIQGLDWWIVEDEYGRDPCLRYKRTTLQLNPITMISKWLENGERVSVGELYLGASEILEARRADAERGVT